MHELMEACDQLAEMLDGAAQDVRRAKLAIIANLVTLAASLVAAAATVWAFGAGAVAGAAATLAARASIQLIIRQLITQMLQQTVRAVGKNIAISAGIGAGIGSSLEVGTQGYENSRGLRDGYDIGDVAQAGGHGAVKGGVQGEFKLGVRGKLPDKVETFSVDKAKQIASDQVSADHIVGGLIGNEVGNATVGKPDEGIGLKDAFNGSSLKIPPETITTPAPGSEPSSDE